MIKCVCEKSNAAATWSQPRFCFLDSLSSSFRESHPCFFYYYPRFLFFFSLSISLRYCPSIVHKFSNDFVVLYIFPISVIILKCTRESGSNLCNKCSRIKTLYVLVFKELWPTYKNRLIQLIFAPSVSVTFSSLVHALHLPDT